MPERIQLRRTKGWRKPEGAIVVARPSVFGNPFTMAGAREWWPGPATATDALTRHFVVACFRDWITNGPQGDWWFLNGKEKFAQIRGRMNELRGHDLACWCPLDQPCHADVLMGLANDR